MVDVRRSQFESLSDGVAVRTLSGSRYQIRRLSDVSYLCRGRNIPSAQSLAYGERWWPVLRPDPWPPVVTERLLISSPYQDDRSHPDRLPGGSKRTSEVVVAEARPTASWHRPWRPPCPLCATTGGSWQLMMVGCAIERGLYLGVHPVAGCAACGLCWMTVDGPHDLTAAQLPPGLE